MNMLHVVLNKDVGLLRNNYEEVPLIAAIEFKFVIRRPDKKTLEEIKMDFQKLQLTAPYANSMYCLIFNRFGPIREKISEIEMVKKSNLKVKAVYSEAYFENDKKVHKEIYWF